MQTDWLGAAAAAEPPVVQQWRDGKVKAMEALRTLASDLGEVLSEQELLKPLKAEEERLRAAMSEILAVMNVPKVELRGFGVLQLTAPSRSRRFDPKRVDSIIGRLRLEGQGDLADELEACATESSSAGSLRITREKASK